MTYNYKLSNGSDQSHDQPNIIPEVLDISKNAYRISIVPRTAFWQLGFRFSQTESIFYENTGGNFGWETGAFRDLYLAAENSSGNESASGLNITTSHFEPGGDLPDSPVPYPEKTEISVYLKFIPNLSQLYVSCAIRDGKVTELFLPLYQDYKYLQLFGWLYKIYYAFDVQVEPLPFAEIEFDTTPFKVGEITFRLGDMFNKEVLQNTNLIILPASGNGTVNPNIYYRASELNIPLPEKMKPGSVRVFDISRKGSKLFAGYGYSVDNDRSSTEIISAFCRSLGEYLFETDAGYENIYGINLPLLGTGAGRMDPRNVARIYESSFNAPNFGVPVTVSIPSGDVFQRIKSMFFGNLIPIGVSRTRPKPESISALEKYLDVVLEDEDYEFNEQDELIRLNLSNQTRAVNLDTLGRYTAIEYLSLNFCYLHGVDFIVQLKNLENLYLRGTAIIDFYFLGALKNLTTLDVGDNNLTDISQIARLGGKLKRLYLGRNRIENVADLSLCRSLEFLDLCDNLVSDITPLANLSSLRSLLLANNHLVSIDGLANLANLVILNVKNNRVADFSVLTKLKKLNYLTADKNPAALQADLLLNENENHLAPLTSFYARQAESGKIAVNLPAKVLLLGNHGSGKSSLLHYLRFKKPGSGISSTHIIKIEQYYISTGKGIPDAIFFDFGGQDYYHGLYRAFLSNGALYLIVWNEANNKNELRREPTTGWTQDFSLRYWLAQKRYLENEKYEGVVDATLLIQTFADRDKRAAPAREGLHDAENEFYISLEEKLPAIAASGLRPGVNEKALSYLETSVNDLILQKKQAKEEPKWYHDFLAYILRENAGENHLGTLVSQISRRYHYKGTDKLERLRTDLQQLHRQGLILYYKDYLPDIAWLSPVAFVRYVHNNLLTKSGLKEFAGKIPVKDFPVGDPNIIELLTKQKVIYYHEAQSQYIIPNFLPLVRTATPGTDLLTFGLNEPIFVLKFKAFIPFGLINQVICFFGGLPAEKQFWRDRVVFVLNNSVKVMINIDFHLMEIKVYCDFTGQTTAGDRPGMITYLFYSIVGLYWDLQILGFNEFRQFLDGDLKQGAYAEGDSMHTKIKHAERFYNREACRPNDLYISLDDKYFIFYPDLCNAQDMIMIAARSLNANRELTDQSQSIPIYPFQPFVRAELRKRRKMVISYSKEDFNLVTKFIDYLIPLSDDELVENPWFCSLLEAGADWNEEIQQRFNDADIIFFMVSENLMKIQYVKENEIRHAIDRYKKYKKVKIVPIILQPYHWARKGDYNLALFNALPYKLTPVTTFQNQNEAWHIISESIRIMINKNLDPGVPDELPSELKKYFERIVAHDI